MDWALGPTLAAALLLAPWPAAATESVWLPSEEQGTAWAEALALAGLTRAPARGASIEIAAHGPSWLLTVRDRQGTLHQVEVRRPEGTDERLDLLYLALSLREPVVEGGQPSAAPPGGAPVARAGTVPPPAAVAPRAPTPRPPP
ncbi:MAG: hypothetical protein ABIO70_26290, partial [Pseudomonadota bacterium]